jgi:hypothetical protein
VTVTIKQAIEVGSQIIELNQTMLLVGPPGVGKTDAIKKMAAMSNRHLYLEHPAVAAPEDYKGFAMFQDGEADFYPLGQWKQIISHPEPFVLGIDDLPQAALATQNGLMQYIHPRGRRLGNHTIPDHCAVIAAGNRKEDNAGVMGLTEPLKDRFATILHIDVSLPEWTEWAIEFGIDPIIITFLHYRPQLLNKFKATRDMSRSPTPRAWEGVNNLMKLKYSNTSLLAEAVSGAVGEAAANEFISFREILTQLPDLDDIERGLAGGASNLNGNECYAIVGALSVRGQTEETLGNVTNYVESMPMEFKVLWSEIWYQRNKNKNDEEFDIPLIESGAWGKWIQKYSKVLSF